MIDLCSLFMTPSCCHYVRHGFRSASQIRAAVAVVVEVAVAVAVVVAATIKTKATMGAVGAWRQRGGSGGRSAAAAVALARWQ